VELVLTTAFQSRITAHSAKPVKQQIISIFAASALGVGAQPEPLQRRKTGSSAKRTDVTHDNQSGEDQVRPAAAFHATG
jgi:hypothetical protein